MIQSIKAIMAVAALFVATIVSVNAQEKTILVDRAAEQIMQERQAVNDASINDIRDRYADRALIFDGNVVGAGVNKGVVEDKADQGISFGPVVGGEMFAGKFSPIGGLSGAYQFRRIRLGLEGYVSIGHPDELSDDQSKFIEWNGVGSVAIEVYRSKSLEHSFLVGAYGSFKAGKNAKYVDLGNGGYVNENQNAFNIGGGGSLTWIYSREWSSISHVIELRAGANHKLHTDGSVEETKFDFGGKKAYFQASISYKLMFGLGSRHRKHYNTSLQNRGYSKSQIERMANMK